MSARSPSNICPTPQKSNAKFLKISPPFSAQTSHSVGGRGAPEYLDVDGVLFFCYLGALAKFQNPSCFLSCRKGRASKRVDNNTIDGGHYVGSAAWQRTQSTRTNCNEVGIIEKFKKAPLISKYKGSFFYESYDFISSQN